MPAVTVILPTYNRAATLPRAISSVLAQSYRDFALTVVDDASSDETPRVVEAITDERLRYVRLQANGGPASARNVGIRDADGEWLAFQDSDDEWLERKLELQMNEAARAPAGVGLILSGYRIVTERGTTDVMPESTLVSGDPTIDILEGWPIITPTWLVRRDLLQRLGGFDESFRCLEDWDLVFRVSAATEVRAIAGPLLLKHGSEDSVFTEGEHVCDALATILERHGHRWRGHPRRLARRMAHLGRVQYELGRTRQARATLGKALRRDPMTPAYYAMAAATFGGPGAMRRVARAWPRQAGMALFDPHSAPDRLRILAGRDAES